MHECALSGSSSIRIIACEKERRGQSAHQDASYEWPLS
jgi:hypothetical protein